MYTIQTRGKNMWVTIGSNRSKDMATALAFHFADELEREVRVVRMSNGMPFEVIHDHIGPRKEN